MSEQVKGGLSNRLRRHVKQERDDDGDANPEGSEADVETGSFQEVTGKEQSSQKGTKGRAGIKRSSRAGKERKEAQIEEDSRGVHSSEESAQPTTDSAQPKKAKRSRRTKRGMSYREETNSEEEDSEEISGEAEKTTFKGKRGQKAKQRTPIARKEGKSKGNVGPQSRLTRSAKSTVSSAQRSTRTNRRGLRRVKEEEMSEEEMSEEEMSEEEGSDEESSEGGGTDSAISGSSEDSGRGKHVKAATRTRLAKRKSDEIDYGIEVKKVRRRGSGCVFHIPAYFLFNSSSRHLYVV